MIWTIVIYLVVAVLVIGIAYAFFFYIERMASLQRKCYPYVHSVGWLRRAVVADINAHYPHAATAVEIGSGYGGMARKMARQCGLRVVALENMPMSAALSKCGDWITRANCRTHWCDAFDYLSRCETFDIAVAYLGPGEYERVAGYHDKFRVLITMDAPVAGLTPVRVVDVGHGYTRYALGRVKMPHRLFVYEFGK